MYTQLSQLSIEEQVECLTKALVKIKSINGTSGEVKIADFIKNTLQSFPYFKENPLHVWEQKINGDTLGRKMYLLLFKAAKKCSNNDLSRSLRYGWH